MGLNEADGLAVDPVGDGVTDAEGETTLTAPGLREIFTAVLRGVGTGWGVTTVGVGDGGGDGEGLDEKCEECE